MASQVRFVVVVHSVKDITGVQSLSQMHLKVKYCNTSLRTRTHKLTHGRINFNETFAFGRKTGTAADWLEIQLRVDSVLSKSTKVGTATIPLRAIMHGQKIDGEYAFDPKGGFVHVSIEIDASSAPVVNKLTQLDEVDSDKDDPSLGPLSGVLKGIASSGAAGSGGRTASQFMPPAGSAVRPPTASAGNSPTTPQSPAAAPASSAQQQQPAPSAKVAPSGTVTAADSTATGSESASQASRRPKLITEGTQTDRPTLSKEEIDSLFSFTVPAVSDSSVESAAGGARGPSGKKSTSPAGRRPKPHQAQLKLVVPVALQPDSDPNTPLVPGTLPSQKSAGELVRAANANPTLQAMRVSSVAWPTDEVESLVLYTKQLEQQRDAAERKLAEFHILRARHASQALAEVANRTAAQQAEPPAWVHRFVDARRSATFGNTLSPSDIAHIYANFDSL